MPNAKCDTFGGGTGTFGFGASVATEPLGFGGGLADDSAVLDPFVSGRGLGGGGGGIRLSFFACSGAGVSVTTFGIPSVDRSLRTFCGSALLSSLPIFRFGRPSRQGGTFSGGSSCSGVSFSSSEA